MVLSKLTTEEKSLNRKYTIASVFTQEQLLSVLKNIVYDDELIIVYYAGLTVHNTGLFKHGDMYCYYDPNSHRGEIREASLEIAEIIFNSSKKYNQGKTSAIAFSIDGFDDAVHVYPKQKDLLTKIGSSADIRALKLSAYMGCLDSLMFFLENGVDQNQLDASINGFTALMCAAQNWRVELIDKLLEKEANLDQVNSDNWTALMLASYGGYIEIVDKLLNKGASPRHTANDGMNALMNASKKGHRPIVDRLLHDKRVEPNKKNSSGITALMYASLYGHTEVVKRLLLDKRVKINYVDNNGTTPLMLAASCGHAEIIKILLDNGADPYQKNNKGFNAGDIARYYGYTNCVTIFMDYYNKKNNKDEGDL